MAKKSLQKQVVQKIFSVSVILLLTFATALSTPKQAHAADCADPSAYSAYFVSGNPTGQTFELGTVSSIDFVIGGVTLIDGQTFEIWWDKTGVGNGVKLDTKEVINNTLSFSITDTTLLNEEGEKSIAMQKAGNSASWCDNLTNFNIGVNYKCDINFTQNGIPNPGCYDPITSQEITVEVSKMVKGGIDPYDGADFEVAIYDGSKYLDNLSVSPGPNNTLVGTYNILAGGGYNRTFTVYHGASSSNSKVCSKSITIQKDQCSDDAIDSDVPVGEAQAAPPFQLCTQLSAGPAQQACYDCASLGGTPQNPGGVWTAIGCIEREPVSIVQRLVELGLGIGGGVALLTALAGGFMITVSRGDPQKVNEAKELIQGALIGILFIIFSVAILEFIGYTVLRIPGFGG